jgi:hypothetical protein
LDDIVQVGWGGDDEGEGGPPTTVEKLMITIDLTAQ